MLLSVFIIILIISGIIAYYRRLNKKLKKEYKELLKKESELIWKEQLKKLNKKED